MFVNAAVGCLVLLPRFRRGVSLTLLLLSALACSAPDKIRLPDWHFQESSAALGNAVANDLNSALNSGLASGLGNIDNTTDNIDDTIWQDFLNDFVVMQAGQSYVQYAKVDKKRHRQLKMWLAQQASMNPNLLNREQFYAYWLNLYNALTVDLILQHYPLKSITKLGGWLSFGPWDDEIVIINHRSLSLNDIEHGILRPIFNDARIHYAVNCASLGCPNLALTAYRADSLEAQLDAQAAAFINHPRGVKVLGNRLQLAKIYHWYQADFGSQPQLLAHLRSYAEPALLQALQRDFTAIEYEYDWALNDI